MAEGNAVDAEQTAVAGEEQAREDVAREQPAPAPAEPAATERVVGEPLTQLGRAVAALQREKLQLKDKWVRSVADAENSRKRARRDQQDAVLRAEEKAVRALLPPIDNLQRALVHAEGIGDPAAQGLVEGVRMVHKQFLQALESLGVTPFESVGQPFDPELHEAIQHVSSEHPPNTVAFELHQGFRREGRLVRPAMVAVSRGPAPPEGAAAPPAGAGPQPENEKP